MLRPRERPLERRAVVTVLALVWVGGLAGALAGCRRDESRPNQVSVSVFAAASLTESFRELERGFEAANPDVDLVLQFAGSQLLASQLLEGADAQLFASADAAQLDRVAEGRALQGRRVFASNQVVLVVPVGSRIQRVEQLTEPGRRVVLAGEAVPAGRYAREALDKLGLRAGVEANVVSNETDVRGVLGKLLVGEADAGMAYASDVTGDQGLEAWPLPAKAAVTARYELAVIADGTPTLRAVEVAAVFADYVVSPAGQAILGEHGLGPIP